MAHVEPYDVNGTTHFRTKTAGQKLTKVNLNSKLNYNLYTKVTQDGSEIKYELVTQNEGNTEARSSYGVFDLTIPNNLEFVRQEVAKAESNAE